MTDNDSLLDALLDALATRPDRVHWERPAILHPVLLECADALRDAGYAVVTGIARGESYLVARQHNEPEVTE